MRVLTHRPLPPVVLWIKDRPARPIAPSFIRLPRISLLGRVGLYGPDPLQAEAGGGGENGNGGKLPRRPSRVDPFLRVRRRDLLGGLIHEYRRAA